MSILYKIWGRFLERFHENKVTIFPERKTTKTLNRHVHNFVHTYNHIPKLLSTGNTDSMMHFADQSKCSNACAFDRTQLDVSIHTDTILLALQRLR